MIKKLILSSILFTLFINSIYSSTNKYSLPNTVKKTYSFEHWNKSESSMPDISPKKAAEISIKAESEIDLYHLKKFLLNT